MPTPTGTRPTSSPPPPSSARRVALAALLVVVVAVVLGFLAIRMTSPPSGDTYTFVVPAGASAAADAGNPVTVLPGDLDLSVGDRVVIHNEDSRTQIVGPFAIRPGEVVDHLFRTPGVFEGQCTVHPTGNITITVT